MSDETIRGHLRAALAQAIAKEETRVRANYHVLEETVGKRIEMMRPIIVALQALSDEVDPDVGVHIHCAEQGHMATIALNSQGQKTTVSTTHDNTRFRTEESWLGPENDFHEVENQYSSSEEVLKALVDTIARHIAHRRVSLERRK